VKKVVIIMLIVLIPAMAFADFQIGATALYTGDITTMGQGSSLSMDNFIFGLDVRAKLWIFQVGTTPLFFPDGGGFYFMNDLGLSLDIWFLRVGLGMGPDFLVGASDGSDSGIVDWNVRATAEIKLGGFSIGLAAWYFMDSPMDIRNIGEQIKEGPPYVSLTALIKLF
jgi:hypothetical protein